MNFPVTLTHSSWGFPGQSTCSAPALWFAHGLLSVGMVMGEAWSCLAVGSSWSLPWWKVSVGAPVKVFVGKWSSLALEFLELVCD